MPDKEFDRWISEYTRKRVDEEAERQGVPQQFARNIANTESGFDPDVITGRRRSSVGAIGTMQLMPGTAKDLGVDPYDIDANISGGISYAKRQLDTFKDPAKAAAAYNWGPGNVQKYGLTKAPEETRNYIRKVAVPNSGDPELEGWLKEFEQQSKPPAMASQSNVQATGQNVPAGMEGGAQKIGKPDRLITKPAGQPVRPGREQQRRDEVESQIQQFEGWKSQASEMIASSDERTRARGFGLLDRANRLAERIGKSAPDLVETGLGDGYAYIKPKAGFVYRKTGSPIDTAGQTLARMRPGELDRKIGEVKRQIREDVRNSEQAAAAPGGIGEFFNQFAQSGIKQLAAIPEGAMELTTAVGSDEAKRQMAEKMLEEGRSPEEVKQFLQGYRPAVDPQFETQIRAPITGITEAGERLGTRAFPVDPTNQGFFSAQLPQAAGSIVPAVLGSALSGGNPLVGGILGAAGQAQQVAREFDQSGVDTGTRDAAIGLAGASGLTEIFGLTRALDKFGMAQPFIKRAIEIFEEGGQEALQQFLGNINARLVGGYDPNRSFSQDVLKSFGLGAIVGAGPEIGSAAFSGLKGRRKRPEALAVAQESPTAAASVFPTMDDAAFGEGLRQYSEGLIGPKEGPQLLGNLKAQPQFRQLAQEIQTMPEAERAQVLADLPTDLAEALMSPMPPEASPTATTGEQASPIPTTAAEPSATTAPPAAPAQPQLNKRQQRQAEIEQARQGQFDSAQRLAQEAQVKAEELLQAGDNKGAISYLARQQQALREVFRATSKNTTEGQAMRVELSGQIRDINDQIRELRRASTRRQANPAPAPATGDAQTAPAAAPGRRRSRLPIEEPPAISQESLPEQSGESAMPAALPELLTQQRLESTEQPQIPAQRRVTQRLEKPPYIDNTERQPVPRATDENIDQLRDRLDTLSRIEANRRGEMNPDLRDELSELRSAVITYEEAKDPGLAGKKRQEAAFADREARNRQRMSREELLRDDIQRREALLDSGDDAVTRIEQEDRGAADLEPPSASLTKAEPSTTASSGPIEAENPAEGVENLQNMTPAELDQFIQGLERNRNESIRGIREMTPDEARINSEALNQANAERTSRVRRGEMAPKNKQLPRGKSLSKEEAGAEMRLPIEEQRARAIERRSEGRRETGSKSILDEDLGGLDDEILQKRLRDLEIIKERAKENPEYEGSSLQRKRGEYEERVRREISRRESGDVGLEEQQTAGRTIQHSRLGTVTESTNQGGVGRGKIRVVKSDGTEAIIQNPRTRGNREAAFVRGDREAAEIRAKTPSETSTKPKVVAEAEARLKQVATGQVAGSGRGLVDQAVVTGYKLYKSGMEFREWARQVVGELGNTVKPYLKEAWRKLQAGTREFIADEEGSAKVTPEADNPAKSRELLAATGKSKRRTQIEAIRQSIREADAEFTRLEEQARLLDEDNPNHEAEFTRLLEEQDRIGEKIQEYEDSLFDLGAAVDRVKSDANYIERLTEGRKFNPDQLESEEAKAEWKSVQSDVEKLVADFEKEASAQPDIQELKKQLRDLEAEYERLEQESSRRPELALTRASLERRYKDALSAGDNDRADRIADELDSLEDKDTPEQDARLKRMDDIDNETTDIQDKIDEKKDEIKGLRRDLKKLRKNLPTRLPDISDLVSNRGEAVANAIQNRFDSFSEKMKDVAETQQLTRVIRKIDPEGGVVPITKMRLEGIDDWRLQAAAERGDLVLKKAEPPIDNPRYLLKDGKGNLYSGVSLPEKVTADRAPAKAIEQSLKTEDATAKPSQTPQQEYAALDRRNNELTEKVRKLIQEKDPDQAALDRNYEELERIGERMQELEGQYGDDILDLDEDSDSELDQPSKPQFILDAEARLKDVASGKRAGSGGQALLDQALVTGYQIYRTGMEFGEWARQVITEAGDSVRPHLREAWNKISESFSVGELPRTREELINSRNFRRFFSGSKVVDEEGNPKVVYHGTFADFERFGRGAEGDRIYFTESPDVASNYATVRGEAETGSPGSVMAVYLSITRPFDFAAEANSRQALELVDLAAREAGLSRREAREMLKNHFEYGDEGRTNKAVHDALADILAEKAGSGPKARIAADKILQKAGYDGISMDSHEEGAESKTWVAFEPTQVKSAIGNKGDFSPSNSSILGGGLGALQGLFEKGKATSSAAPKTAPAATDTQAKKQSQAFSTLQNLQKRAAEKTSQGSGPQQKPATVGSAAGEQLREKLGIKGRSPQTASEYFQALMNKDPLPEARKSPVTRRGFDEARRALQRTAEKADKGKIGDKQRDSIISAADDLMTASRLGNKEGIKEAMKALRDAELGNNVAKRAARSVQNALKTSRSLVFGGDLSFPLRQALPLTVPPQNWWMAAKSGKSMWNALWTEKGAEGVKQMFDSHPYADLADRAGLELTHFAGAEEVYGSNAAEKIPLYGRVMKRTEAANNAYLDHIRLESFAKMAKSIENNQKLSPKQKAAGYKAAAEAINTLTGRTDIGEGKLKTTVEALQGVMTAPRLNISRIQLLNPMKYAKLHKQNPMVARQTALMVGETLGGIALLGYGAAMTGLASFTLDPEDQDFGKIVVGDTRYDLSGGLLPVIKTAISAGGFAKDFARSFYDESEESQEALRASRSQAGQRAETFLRGRLAPAASLTYDIAKGKDLAGKPVTSKELKSLSGNNPLLRLYAPATGADLIKGFQQAGWEGVGKTAPAFFGAGAATYSDEDRIGFLDRKSEFAKAGKEFGVKVGKLKRDEAEVDGKKIQEPDDVYRSRTERVDGWLKEYTPQLRSNPQFADLTREQKKKALSELKSAAVGQSDEPAPALYKLDPDRIIRAVLRADSSEAQDRRLRNKPWAMKK